MDQIRMHFSRSAARGFVHKKYSTRATKGQLFVRPTQREPALRAAERLHVGPAAVAMRRTESPFEVRRHAPSFAGS